MLGLAFVQMTLLLELLYLWRDKVTFATKSKNEMIPAKKTAHPALLFLFTLLFFLLSQRYFFATGHQRALSSIQYEVGFIGMEKVNWIISPILILLNTYGSHILFSMALPLLGLWKRALLGDMEARFLKEMKMIYMSYIGIILLNLSSATVFAGHFRRHLMVWRVFAPKFLFTIFESGVMIMCLLTSLVCVTVCSRHSQTFLLKLQQMLTKQA